MVATSAEGPEMQVDATFPRKLADVREQARQAEAAGYDALWSVEIDNDPFLPVLLGADATERIAVGTRIAVALARSPMTVAYTAWDLQRHSGGRLLLGLGSQIQPHIERRFAMPWSAPAARMKEYVCALRAIWDCWQNGTPLDFAGDFYTHTLMPPFFTPAPVDSGTPPVMLAAVGEAMTRVAGEVADGLMIHGLTTERYLREITLPAVEAALAGRGKERSDFQVSYPAIVITGETEEEFAASDAAARSQIAFYASTPAYRPVLELHGQGELQRELQLLTRQDRWAEMGALIDDDLVAVLAVSGPPRTLREVALRALRRARRPAQHLHVPGEHCDPAQRRCRAAPRPRRGGLMAQRYNQRHLRD
jgi:probable F420-dependent oxidoreductase